MNSITNNLGDDATFSNQTISYKYLMDFINPYIMGPGEYPVLEWLDTPIETIYKRDDKITGVEFVALTLIQSSPYLNFIKPQTIYSLDITHPIEVSDYTPVSIDLSTKDSKLKPRITFEYDTNGNMVGQAETNGRKICYIGCNATSNKPLMVLKGMTYAEYVASGALGNWDRENVNSKRASCPNIQITSYTYDPKFGTPTSVTSANGLSTYYEYDGFGRLRNVKDNNQNLLKTYEYTSKVQ
jgi:YD repeat-containing protein